MKKSESSKSELRRIPAVSRMLDAMECTAENHGIVMEAIRQTLDDARSNITKGIGVPEFTELVAQVNAKLNFMRKSTPAKVINATGIVIHTGLGRSVLSESAAKRVSECASSYCALELDLETNTRGSRQSHVSELLKSISGSGESLVVNNNAAAVLLAVNTLASGKEVIISRGQLVEIGGSFRLPDIIESAGAELVEVGTTNRTRITDYEKAISDKTGLVMRCHPSNFKISGFTEEASLQELVDLCRAKNIPLLDDMGSGALIDVTSFGLEYEATVQDSVNSGCGLVCFSGDKLLGGPQCGILVGNEDIIQRLKINPLARAMRIDKLSLAALEATLKEYRWGDPVNKIPTLRYLSRTAVYIRNQAENILDILKDTLINLSVDILEVESEVGGGAIPGQKLPSFAVALYSEGVSSEYISILFRRINTPVLGRLHRNVFLLDMRTVDECDIETLAECIREVDALISKYGGNYEQ